MTVGIMPLVVHAADVEEEAGGCMEFEGWRR